MMEQVENVRQQVQEHGSLEEFYLNLVQDENRT
jgi:hypothetical protein